MSTPSCPNCGAAITGAWCAACGQRVPHGRLDAHELLHESVHAVTHADLGVLRLLRDLAVRPRAMYAAYLGGARKRYMNPVLFLLLVEGLYIASTTFLLDHQLATMGPSGSLLAERAVRQADKLKVMIGIPVVSLASWLLFRARYHLAEILVFWCFCFGFMTLVDMLGMPLEYVMPVRRETIRVAFGWLAGLTMAWHIIGFFAERRGRSVVAAVGLTLFTQVALNYAFRLVYRLKGYDVDMGIAATLRDSFGL